MSVLAGLVMPLTILVVTPTGAEATAAAQSAAVAAVQAPPALQAPAAADVAISAATNVAWTAGGLIETPPPAAAPVSSGFASVGGCQFYATSSSAGGVCASGGPGGVVQTLQAYLAGRPFIYCRFFDIPEGMYLNAPEREGGEWQLQACFKDIDLTQPWGGQDATVEVFQQFVEDGVNTDIPDYMLAFWRVKSAANYYPIPRISIGPSSPARVNAYTFFWATWVEALDSSQETKADYRVAYNTPTAGTVYLHASIHKVTIHPAPSGMDPVDCGKADVEFNPDASDPIPVSEGGSQPSECWTTYTHSTASRDEDTVQLKATASWRVAVERADGTVIQGLGDFDYFTTQRLAVAEDQTLVESDDQSTVTW